MPAVSDSAMAQAPSQSDLQEKEPTEEDKRNAAALETSVVLSTATSALTILLIMGAIFAYVAANFQSLAAFYVLFGLAALLMLLTGFFSASHVMKIVKSGYGAEWS